MGVRKNQNKLTDTEKSRFVAAVKKMKADAAAPYNYDKFVAIHALASPTDPIGRVNNNPAHRGPAFFPWHRYFLLKFENDLKAADMALGGDGTLTLPYWDWTHDNADEPNSQRGSIWKDNFLGGFGSPVTTGPFRDGLWTLAPPAGGSLVRALGRTAITPGTVPSLPEKSHVEEALNLEGFDTQDWDDGAVKGPALAPPPAPILAGVGGGGLPPGTYRVSISYINARGETRPSSESVICLGGGCAPPNTNNAIQVN
jgi:tyrosinase